MGNAQVPRVDEPRVLLTEYSSLVFHQALGSYKLFKVMQCVHEREGLVVVKVFISREGAPETLLKDVQQRIDQVKEAFGAQWWLHPHVVPYQGMEITSRSAILLRQHFARNLYDRMYTRPFLSELAKKWIAFQVLCSVSQAHSVGVAHGDLKTENVFISSWNHAVLSDFAMFKPLLLPEDDPSSFSFYFESDLKRRRCYLAPERFEGSASRTRYVMNERFSQELAAMDVFSLGCVLAELFLDGQTVLDLPELLQYRSGQLDLRAKISCIQDPAVQEILGSMLDREPTRRKPASVYLREWCKLVAPESFSKCFFPLSVLLLHPIYQQPDMRISLIQHNFAQILWSVVGSVRIARRLSATKRAGESLEDHSADAVWRAWQQHIALSVCGVDEATLHSTVHAAAQAAAQWASAPPAADLDSRSRAFGGSSSTTSRQEPVRSRSASGSGCRGQDVGADAADLDSANKPTGSLLSRLAHPLLRESVCESFVTSLFNYWDEGRRKCAETGLIECGDKQPTAIYNNFLSGLCSSDEATGLEGSCSQHSAAGAGAVGPSQSQAPPRDPEVTGISLKADEDALYILCGFLCSSLQHLSSPRLKVVCLDMFQQIAPFTSQDTVLEQIVPYTHSLMTDPVAKVRSRAIDVMTRSLERIDELPPSDMQLFTEYIFPQLMSAMSQMNSEPIVLLAIARNIGALAKHAVRFAELSVASASLVQAQQAQAQQAQAAQRAGAGGGGGTGAGEAGSAASASAAAAATSETSRPVAEAPTAEVEIETFDVQWKRLREEVERVVKALIEHPKSAQALGSVPAEYDPSGGVGFQEEGLVSLAAGREIKMALLRNMRVLADIFGRDGTINFLLPYLISFMNDPSWEVRAAFCEEAACLPRKVGQVSTEGIIWPCYEQALLDQEERVVGAALRGLAVLVAQRVLNRQSLDTIASKVAPLLVHPSVGIRDGTVQVFAALSEQLTPVEQYVFLLPVVRPFLKMSSPSLQSLPKKLVSPLSRQCFKRAVMNRDDALHDALLNKKPLPAMRGSAGEDEEEEGAGDRAATAEIDRIAMELLRPYVHPLLRTRPSVAQMAGAASLGLKDESGSLAIAPAIGQTLQFAIVNVNPACPSSRSMHALTECDVGERLPLPPSAGLQHPLGLFSTQSFLVQALRLPPRHRDLGRLSSLDGTPYSIYAASSSTRSIMGEVGVDMRSPAERTSSADGAQDLADSEMDAVLSSSGLQVPMASSGERRSASLGMQARRGRPEDAFSAGELDVDTDRFLGGAGKTIASTGSLVLGGASSSGGGASAGTWRPRGVLLATLYEYAHQSGVPVVKVDTTDDSRVLVTGGRDGVVKVWNCAALERDVAVSSSHTFSAPECSGAPGSSATGRRRQRLRALRTVRNSKAIAVGSEAGDVYLYRIDGRGGAAAAQVCCCRGAERHGMSSVMCIEQFDTDLDSLVVFAQEHGRVLGWDVRCPSPSWAVSRVPPWLGVPNCLALGSEGHAITVGTLGGGLLVYDLRFLARWKQWRVSSGAAVLGLRSASFGRSSGVFAALGSDTNEVAFFDVFKGSCLTLFLTDPVGDRPRDAAFSVPNLLDASDGPGGSAVSGISPEQLQLGAAGSRHAQGSVRSLWMPSRGPQTFLLAAGSDRKVRHWSLDPEHHEAYVVTPHDSLSPIDRLGTKTTYSSNHWGDVFVVQEQPAAKDSQATRGAAGRSTQGGFAEPEDATRPKGTNPNHRDAILDMCAISLQQDILVTAGRDGLIKLWK